ncbi:HAD-IC family P-type ATPase [Nitrososphaera sp. AFS]|uniref:HAD-IC family P-type ATPase n=1 Tax=Nitrososphaera sp. AFS TaxID=2301191 RepID=UPI0019178F3C|nr:HAD-IC family P-type ATPase [Nitrososphaera sp. AFS]
MIRKLVYNGKKSTEALPGSRGISNINISKVIGNSVLKLNPWYLARENAVMFTVEVLFLVVLFVGMGLTHIPKVFASQTQAFYYASAVILIITVWFSTFSEALSEAQARARVDSLRNLEREVTARKIVGDKREVIVNSRTLKPGDEVLVYSGEVIPRDGIVMEGKAFVDESMMTGESNPVFKEKDDHVIGGTRIASDRLRIEITSEAGRSFLDQMVTLIESATRPKTKNEIALTILLAGLSLIFIMVVGSLLFFAYFLGYIADIGMLIALLVALMPTTIGGLLSAIGVAGITRIGRDNIVAKSGKGIEAAGDADILILDKTGTITEGSRAAITFIPLEKYTERDVGQAAFAASIHDNTHEGKSIVHLAEEKGFIPPLVEKMLVARQLEFSAETCYSGIELIKNKRVELSSELQEEATAIHKFEDGNGDAGRQLKTDENVDSKVSKMLLELDSRNQEFKILKGSVETMLKLVPNVNEAELKWKAQEISKNGQTPFLVAIDIEAIGLVALKDNLKENICQRLEEVRAAGITTVMITGDNILTAQVIAKEANVDQIMAEAKPSDKLTRVQEEQLKGHVIGMVGDGTNDAPALAKADVGLAMNSGTAAAKEAANMVDLDSDPSKILRVVKLGKQLLMTRGAITTFSIANDVAKYFAIIPAMFIATNPKLAVLNIMQLHSPTTAILATLIFNAIIIPALIPLSLRGVTFRPEPPEKTFIRNMLIYGLGGVALPFVAIKAIDMLLTLFLH